MRCARDNLDSRGQIGGKMGEKGQKSGTSEVVCVPKGRGEPPSRLVSVAAPAVSGHA